MPIFASVKNNNTFCILNNLYKYLYFKRITQLNLEIYLNQYLIIEKYYYYLFLIKNDKDLLLEIGFSERDINRLNLEFKNILKEQHEE